MIVLKSSQRKFLEWLSRRKNLKDTSNTSVETHVYDILDRDFYEKKDSIYLNHLRLKYIKEYDSE